jgi:hypothetical protein
LSRPERFFAGVVVVNHKLKIWARKNSFKNVVYFQFVSKH